MYEYRLYRFQAGHIRHAEEFVCEDDAAAIVHVERVLDDEAIELWQSTRLVRRFEPLPGQPREP